jgi:DNA-binding MarR family transcriptional regulator
VSPPETLPPETELDALLVGKLLTLAQGAQQRALDVGLRPLGLSRVQMGVLQGASQDGVVMSELAGKLACHVSNLTGVVDRMERDGLVERVRSSRDRRAVFVRLTELGQQRRSQLQRALPLLQQTLSQGLSANERTQLCRLLEKYVAGAQRQLEAQGSAARMASPG